MKLLVVDDHAELRCSLRQTLELEGPFEVVADASNGVEALERVDAVHPDVVLMDAKMPVMDGAEATRRIKERWPGVCVVALSSTGEPHVAAMLDAGASGYVLKGEPVGHLVASLQRSIVP